MTRWIGLFILMSVSLIVQAQDDEQPVSIKVRKQQDIVKVVFDNTEYKLFPVDRFGNPRNNEVVSYMLWIKEKKGTKKFTGYNNDLTFEMLKELKKLKKATKIFFTQIKLKDDNGHIIDMPDIIDVWFPDCKNCLK